MFVRRRQLEGYEERKRVEAERLAQLRTERDADWAQGGARGEWLCSWHE